MQIIPKFKKALVGSVIALGVAGGVAIPNAGAGVWSESGSVHTTDSAPYAATVSYTVVERDGRIKLSGTVADTSANGLCADVYVRVATGVPQSLRNLRETRVKVGTACGLGTYKSFSYTAPVLPAPESVLRLDVEAVRSDGKWGAVKNVYFLVW